MERNMSESDKIKLEKSYSKGAMASKLRRLADAVENSDGFRIMLEKQRIYVPVDAWIEFEYEESDDECELEIEIKWKK